MSYYYITFVSYNNMTYENFNYICHIIIRHNRLEFNMYIMKQKTDTTAEFTLQEELLTLLKRLIPLHSVYVISVNNEKQQHNTFLLPQSVSSQKMVTYTLLIITHKPISRRLGDFMDDMYNKMERRCKIYAIMHTLSRVKKKLDYGSNFLHRAIFQTSCIYKADNSLSKFKNYALLFHKKVYHRIQETWTGRMNRAEYLLSIIGIIESEEDSASRLSIMHHAIEQTCMALLYVFWEFTPQYYSLPYLLHLCSNFTQMPQNIFPKETYGVHRIHYMLCNAHHIMRFKAQNEFSCRDADKAYNRCEQFYEEAKILGDKYLSDLKQLHCKSLL